MNRSVLNDAGWWALSIVLLALSIYVGTESWLTAPIVLLAALLSNPHTSSHIKDKIHLARFLNLKTIGTLCCLFISVLVMNLHLSAIAKEEQAIAAKKQVAQQEIAKIAALQAAEKVALEKKELERAENERREKAATELNKNKANIIAQMDLAIEQMDEDLAHSLIQKYGYAGDSDFLEKERKYRNALELKKKEAKEAELKEKFEKLAAEAEVQRLENYKTQIRSYALEPYTSAQYPKTVKKYRSRLKEIEVMRRRAAEAVVDSGKCDYVETVELSDSRSSLRDIHIWVDCTNQQRFYLSEKEIKESSPAKAESEKAWSTDDAMTACRELIKDNATIPSSVDIHVFGSDIYRSETDGRVVIKFNFDAKNEYGAEIGFTANCYFEPQRAGTIEISLRR